MFYNEILQHIEQGAEIVWKFKRISAQKEPFWGEHTHNTKVLNIM